MCSWVTGAACSTVSTVLLGPGPLAAVWECKAGNLIAQRERVASFNCNKLDGSARLLVACLACWEPLPLDLASYSGRDHTAACHIAPHNIMKHPLMLLWPQEKITTIKLVTAVVIIKDQGRLVAATVRTQLYPGESSS